MISAHDKKIKKSDKTRHNSNFFDELNHAKSYQTWKYISPKPKATQGKNQLHQPNDNRFDNRPK